MEEAKQTIQEKKEVVPKQTTKKKKDVLPTSGTFKAIIKTTVNYNGITYTEGQSIIISKSTYDTFKEQGII